MRFLEYMLLFHPKRSSTSYKFWNSMVTVARISLHKKSETYRYVNSDSLQGTREVQPGSRIRVMRHSRGIWPLMLRGLSIILVSFSLLDLSSVACKCPSPRSCSLPFHLPHTSSSFKAPRKLPLFWPVAHLLQGRIIAR